MVSEEGSLAEAMARAKKILLLHERRETLRLRFKRTQRSGRCAYCDAEVEWFTPLEAAEFLSLTEREVFRLVEAGRFHLFESEVQSLLVCRRSLEGLSEK